MLFLHGEYQSLLLKFLLRIFPVFRAVVKFCSTNCLLVVFLALGPFTFLAHVTLPYVSNSFNYLLVSQQSSCKRCFGYYLVPCILSRGIEKFRNNAPAKAGGGNYTIYKYSSCCCLPFSFFAFNNTLFLPCLFCPCILEYRKILELSCSRGGDGKFLEN